MNLMEDLKAYVDGELSPARRAEIEAAMDRDERLRQEMEEIRVLSRLIDDCVVEPEPIGLDATLAALAKAKPRPLFARVLRNPLRYGWAFALCGFVILAVCFPLFQQAGSSAKNDAVAMRTEAAATHSTENSAWQRAQGQSNDSSLAPESDAAKSPSATANGDLPDDAKMRSQFGSRAAVPSDGTAMNGVGGFAGKSPGRSQKAKSTEAGEPRSYGVITDVPHEMPQTDSEAQVISGGTISRSPRVPMLIRSGDFGIEVPKVQVAQVQVTTLAKRMNGYVEVSQTSAPTQGLPTAYLSMRVPVSKFDPTVTELRNLGKVLAESTNGQDVTAQVVDTEARLKAKRAEEQGYVEMMKGARKVPDMLEIRDRLGSVREEIESMEAERKSLRQQAAYSTISVTLSQPDPAKLVVKAPAKPNWFDSAWRQASQRASALGKWLAEVGMNLVVLAPVWLPIVVGLWWLGRRAKLR